MSYLGFSIKYVAPAIFCLLSYQVGVGQTGAPPADSDAEQADPDSTAIEPIQLDESVAEAEMLSRVGEVMGYNICRNFKADNPDADFKEILAGIKSAAAGDKRKSFIFGYQFYSRLKEEMAGVTAQQLEVGIEKVIAGEELGRSDEEIQKLMTSFGRMMQRKQVEKQQQILSGNIKAGQEYLAQQIKSNQNLKELKDGIYYEVLKEGQGEVAGPNADVVFDYTGSFTNGEVFDSSEKPLGGGPGRPSTSNVNGLIPGFSKSLQAMNKGARWRVIIPGEQAYGERPQGNIGPMQTLVFELTLVDVVSRDKAAE